MMENNKNNAKQFFKEHLISQGNDNMSAKDIEEIIQAKYADMFWEVMVNYTRQISELSNLAEAEGAKRK